MALISTYVDIVGFTCLVFKTTCIDRRIPLREDAFFFTRTMLFPPLNERNTRDKAQGLCITSERYNRVNHFCLPGWVLLDNRTVCEVVIEGQSYSNSCLRSVQ